MLRQEQRRGYDEHVRLLISHHLTMVRAPAGDHANHERRKSIRNDDPRPRGKLNEGWFWLPRTALSSIRYSPDLLGSFAGPQTAVEWTPVWFPSEIAPAALRHTVCAGNSDLAHRFTPNPQFLRSRNSWPASALRQVSPL